MYKIYLYRLSICLILTFSTQYSFAQEYDIILTNGRIIDGSGSPWYQGDIGIKDGKIARIGYLKDQQTKEVVDVRQKIISPGFIDVHGHIESSILKRPTAENLIRDGVLTMITGNCGSSKADIGAFAQALQKEGTSINVASLIGHNTVRRTIMGEEDRAPTEDELLKMQQMVSKAMEDGAVGLSTGLLYLPGMFAKTEEIIALAKMIAPYEGIYTSHIRWQDHRVFESVAEAVSIGKGAAIPVQVSHIKIKGKNSWGQYQRLLDELTEYRQEGIDVTIDQYPYTAASTGLSVCVPKWVQAGGREALAKKLQDPDTRAKVKREMKEMLSYDLGFEDYAYAYIANCPWDASLNGKHIKEITQEKKGNTELESQMETILELLEHQQRVQMVYHFMGEEDVKGFMQSPLTMIASDGGIPTFGKGNPHPRSYGTNARVIHRYVHELKLFSLEEAIHKMTYLPARKFHLDDRGLIKEGMAADLLIFDPEAVQDKATFDQPHQFSTGFDQILVNGKWVIKDGKHTGERSGQFLGKQTKGYPKG